MSAIASWVEKVPRVWLFANEAVRELGLDRRETGRSLSAGGGAREASS